MKVILLETYGDFDIATSDGIYVGEGKLPNIEEGILKEDLIKILEDNNYKKVDPLVIRTADDFLCNSPNEEERKDKRLRVSSIIKGI